MNTPVHSSETANLRHTNALLEQAHAACDVIPPLWPLRHFIAVNPFLNLIQRPFLEAAKLLESTAHHAPLMDQAYFAERLRSDAVEDVDLETALRLLRVQAPDHVTSIEAITPTHLKLWANSSWDQTAHNATVPALSDFAGASTSGPWSEVVTGEIAKFCAAYFDEGQASWRMPWASLPLFDAWREFASHDASIEWHGLADFRAFVRALPTRVDKAIISLLDGLELDATLVGLYSRRLLLTVYGWGSHVRYRARENELKGIPDESLLHLLAIRLAYDVALSKSKLTPSERRHWVAKLRQVAEEGADDDLWLRCAWQLAVEAGYQRRLSSGITAATPVVEEAPSKRPAAQAVFCIDVRSEVFRRSLEAQSDQIETLGFAGFFGMAIEHIPFGRQHGHAQCPALIQPQFRVRERPHQMGLEKERKLLSAVMTTRRIRHAWNAFKSSAISCFSFVETAGLAFLFKLAPSLATTAGGRRSAWINMAPHVHDDGCPHQSAEDIGEARTGIPSDRQADLAYGALRHMGLTRGFARLVLLCGHGSTSANNPYASSLDCGACGGHAGDANARVAATLLNDPAVRKSLVARGIVIPEDTWFLAGLHDTTTDDVTLFSEHLPNSHRADFGSMRDWLDLAGHDTRCKRAAKLGLTFKDAGALLEQTMARTADWSQVRPEWGLAGNAAFVAAPRERTQHLNLGGRVFLHTYRHDIDHDNATLEVILSAPVVVASWITLQYYGSTVNNALYGSGNKVLHNVVGTLGVCLGNGGDLRPGLPLQSVHNGQTWVHEPLRLSVFIEAHREHLCLALSRLPETRALFDNGWLHLFAIEPDSQTIYRYLPEYQWETAQTQPT